VRYQARAVRLTRPNTLTQDRSGHPFGPLRPYS
jgi:hypothetical protein